MDYIILVSFKSHITYELFIISKTICRLIPIQLVITQLKLMHSSIKVTNTLIEIN